MLIKILSFVLLAKSEWLLIWSMAHRGAGILVFLSFERFHISTERSISSIFISVGRLSSFSLNILPSLTRRFIVLRGEGGFMIHTETSGRSTYRNLLGPVIPSLPICQGMFALCDCWLGQPTVNPAFTKCKQKLISTLGSLDVFTVFSYF